MSKTTWLRTFFFDQSAEHARRRYLGAVAILGVVVLISRALTHVSALANEARELSDLLVVFGLLLPGMTPLAANVVLPKVLGAERQAFPRVEVIKLYLFVFGVILLVLAQVMGAQDPAQPSWILQARDTPNALGHAATLLSLGVFFVALSMLATAANVIVSTVYLRKPGLGWRALSLDVWALLIHSGVTIIAAPVLCASVAVRIAEQTLHLGLVDSAVHGSPAVSLHLFWFALHPLLVTSIVPVLGVAVGSRGKNTTRLVAALALFAVLSFLGYGQHLASSGVSELFASLSSFYSLLGVAPLIYLVGLSVSELGSAPVTGWRLAMVTGLTLVATTWFIALALAAGALSTHVGFDVVLFGATGRDLLVGLLLIGVLSLSARARPDQLAASEQAV